MCGLAVVDMLTGWGYRVTAAENPDIAAGILDRDPYFDLLFTDIVMPGTLSAIELARHGAAPASGDRCAPDVGLCTRSHSPARRGRVSDDRQALSQRRAGGEGPVGACGPVAGASAAARASFGKAEGTLPPKGGLARRILLVEDEVVLRMSTTDMLERLECLVAGVGSGEEALELLLKGSAFDFLLTDLGLPGMSGEELAREVRRRFPDLPVIIASGYGPTGTQPAGVRFISKPIPRSTCSRRSIIRAGPPCRPDVPALQPVAMPRRWFWHNRRERKANARTGRI